MVGVLKATGLFIRANPWRVGALALLPLAAWLAIDLNVTEARLHAEKQGRRADAEQHQKEIAEAVAGHTATARAIEQAQAAVSIGVGKDVSDRLDRIGAGVDRLRRQAAEGHSAPAYLPGTADATLRTDRAVEGDGLLRVDPDVIGECQRNTEIALGWQQWWRGIEKTRGE